MRTVIMMMIITKIIILILIKITICNTDNNHS